MDTIESNKLTAEFMGFTNTTPTDPDFNIYENSEGHFIDIMSAKYHNSWDWLMPVVRKIVEICIDDDRDQYFKTNWDLFESACYTSILETIPLAIIEDSYKVVVEFIKYYNKQKQ